MRENEIITSREVRQSMMGKLEVLDKVKALVLLPNDLGATTEMVANYFEVGIECVNSLVKDNRSELEMNGLSILTGEELRSFKDICQISSRARAISTFSRRTILNVAMLLRDSIIAKEIRRVLLDATEDKQIAEQVAMHITQEQQLQLAIINSSDDMELAIALKNYKQFKDAHAKQLEVKVDELAKEVDFKGNVISGLTEDIPLMEKRQRIVQIIRHNSRNYSERWSLLYDNFDKKYHVDSKRRMENAKARGEIRKTLNRMGYICQIMNMTDELYEIACKIFEGDFIELLEEWKRTVTNK